MDAIQRRAIGLMAAAIGFMTLMDGSAKLLIESGVHAAAILAVRSALITLVMGSWLMMRGQGTLIRTRRPVAQLTRGALGICAVGGFFSSLAYLSLADATVIFFTGTLFIAVASVLVLGERFGPHRWIAIAVGYLGVAVAMQPGFDGKWFGYALALVGSLSYAALFITGKLLSRTEHTVTLVFWFNLGLGLVATATLPWVWTPLDPGQWGLIGVISLLALGGHLMITQAFATAPASSLAPIEYTGLLWALSLDILIWQQPPEGLTLLGAAIVILSSLYYLRRERLAGLTPPARSNPADPTVVPTASAPPPRDPRP